MNSYFNLLQCGWCCIDLRASLMVPRPIVFLTRNIALTVQLLQEEHWIDLPLNGLFECWAQQVPKELRCAELILWTLYITRKCECCNSTHLTPLNCIYLLGVSPGALYTFETLLVWAATAAPSQLQVCWEYSILCRQGNSICFTLKTITCLHALRFFVTWLADNCDNIVAWDSQELLCEHNVYSRLWRLLSVCFLLATIACVF